MSEANKIETGSTIHDVDADFIEIREIIRLRRKSHHYILTTENDLSDEQRARIKQILDRPNVEDKRAQRDSLMRQLANANDETTEKLSMQIHKCDQDIYLSTETLLTSREVNGISTWSSINPSEPAATWRNERRIFGIRRGRAILHPSFQFYQGEPLLIIQKILKTLPETWTDWDVAFWFKAENGWIDPPKPPQEALADGSALNAALQLVTERSA